jgi:hypothetical protein
MTEGTTMRLTTDIDFLDELRIAAFSAAKRHVRDERATLTHKVELHGTSAIVTLRTSADESETVRVHIAYAGGVCTTLADDEDTLDLEGEYQALRASGYGHTQARRVLEGRA